MRDLLEPGESPGAELVVAIPARDEAARIGQALRAIALAAAPLPTAPKVVLLADGCRDGTGAEARAAADRAGLALQVVSVGHDAGHGAGRARRLAMSFARGLVGADGVLLTTDADAALAPGALLATLEAVARGADLVCGAIDAPLPPRLAAAPSLRRLRAIATPYEALQDEVRHAIDILHRRQPPGEVPHYGEFGACMAMTARVLDGIGGIPDLPAGEDRATVRAAERAGARVIYAPALRALASARLDGRAVGGMADALKAALAEPDPPADPKYLPAARIASLWARALDGGTASLGAAQSDPPLHAGAMERDLQALSRFVAGAVRPMMVGRAAAAHRASARVTGQGGT